MYSLRVALVLFSILCYCFCQNQLDIAIGSKTGGFNVPIASYTNVAQSFQTTATSINKITAWISATTSITLQLKDGFFGNVLGSSTVTINGNQGGVDFVFASPITVTPGNIYFAFVSTNFLSNWTSDAAGTYSGGAAWLAGTANPNDFWMDVYGTVPDQTCVGTVTSSGGSASCGNTPIEFNILQPTSDLLLCNMDIVGRTIADTNAIFDFAIYESNSNNVVDTYTKVSSVVKYASGGNSILNGIVNPTPLRPDRYYLFGWSCTNCAVGVFNNYQCDAGFSHPNFTFAGAKYGIAGTNLPNSYDISGLYDGGLRLYLKIYTKPYQVTPTTGDSNFLLTTSPLTTSPVTSGLVTTGWVSGGISEDVRVYGAGIGGGLVLNYNGADIAQSFVTRATSIIRARIWGYVYATLTISIRDGYNGNVLGSATTSYSGNGEILFIFPTAVAVTPGQTYWLQVSTTAQYNSWAGYSSDAPYVDGCAWGGSGANANYDMLFITEGYLPPPNPFYADCSSYLPAVTGNGGCGNTPTEIVIFKPARDMTLCMLDIVQKQLASTTASLDFVVYESNYDDPDSAYTRKSIVTRSAASGNIILRNITTGKLNLRSDRYYAIGFSCSEVGCFNFYTCGGAWDDQPGFHYVRSLQAYGATSFGPNFNFLTLQGSGLRCYFRFYASDVSLTTSPMTSGSVTSGAMTSSPLTSGDVTTSPVTSVDVTTARYDITTSQVTSGDITTLGSSVTTGSNAAVTTGVANSSPVTTGVSNPPVTTGDAPVGGATTGAVVNIQSESDSGNGNRVAIGAGVGGGLAALIIVAIILIAFILLGRKKKTTSSSLSSNVDIESKVMTNSAPSSSSQIPMLKNIEIKRKLGGGSFGEVFLGNWNGTKVALKKLKDKDQFEEFMKEAGTLSQVIHPNCVQFLGIFTADNGDQYMVTEYLPKGALRTTLLAKKDKVTVVDLLTMSVGAAKGLAYLESKNILHRDVALRNLLAAKIDGEYTAKVSDFGLSRSTSSGEYQMKAETKVPIKWTAPEVLKGSRVTIKNDVWAFGVTMWEIFSFGQEPYAWMSNKEAFIEIPKGERLPKPDNCPDEVFQVMMKCWENKPEDRPSFVELVKELKAIRKNMLKAHPELRKSELSPNVDHQVSATNDPSRTPTGTPGNTNPSTIGSGYTSIPGKSDEEEEDRKPIVAVRSGSRRPLGQSETYERTPKNTLDSDSDD